MEPRQLAFLAGFVAYVVIRGAFEARCRGRPVVLSRRDGVERALLALVALGNVLLPVLHLATPWLGFADWALPVPLAWPGAALMVLALWLFWRAHSDLGTHWSVSLELREGHELVRDGVYRRMRHPMYAAIWLFSLAQALLLPNWLAGCSALVAFGAMYGVRVSREERLLHERFGAVWEGYERSTGRLWPRGGRG
jgi:protein-S-isoprenylcysteine O-methyltransferase Ste14